MKNNLIISLGHNCYVSWTIRKVGFQNESYPLDWLNSFAFSGVVKFLKARNADFVNHLTASYVTNEDDDDKILFSKEFDFRLPHEYDKDVTKSMSAIGEMYERRIERLFDHCSRADGVVFIRNINRTPYKSVPGEDLDTLNKYATEFCDYMNSALGHNNFVVLFTSYDNVSLSFTHPQCLFINNVLPFENGFFEYDYTKLHGKALFEFKKKFFESLSLTDVSQLNNQEVYKLYLNSSEN